MYGGSRQALQLQKNPNQEKAILYYEKTEYKNNPGPNKDPQQKRVHTKNNA